MAIRIKNINFFVLSVKKIVLIVKCYSWDNSEIKKALEKS